MARICTNCKKPFIRKKWHYGKYTCPQCYLDYIKKRDESYGCKLRECPQCKELFPAKIPYKDIFCPTCVKKENKPLCSICGQVALGNLDYCKNCYTYVDYISGLNSPIDTPEKMELQKAVNRGKNLNEGELL